MNHLHQMSPCQEIAKYPTTACWAFFLLPIVFIVSSNCYLFILFNTKVNIDLLCSHLSWVFIHCEDSSVVTAAQDQWCDEHPAHYSITHLQEMPEIN